MTTVEKIDLSKLELNPAKKNTARKFPKENGIYIFLDEKKNILYIGKAKNLKNRISSYFQSKLLGKTKVMMHKAKYLTYIPVSSEIESLLLEARLIRREKPQYNLELKDDKHPLYIRVTNEEFPRILTARRIDSIKHNKNVYGPFPSSSNVKSVLKLVRKIFPYSTHKLGKRGCVHSQIGLCEPCPNIINISNENERNVLTKQYHKNIKYIISFLDGNFSQVKNNLLEDIKLYSANEEFEKAKNTKNQLDQISYITQPILSSEEYVKNPNLLSDIRKDEVAQLKLLLRDYFDNISNISRIECFDVAHLQGSFPTASMVTFINGDPDKSLYRIFGIKQKKGRSDTDSLNEVAKRRSSHFNDWGTPDLIIVDGGKGQVSAFVDVFGDQIPIVGVAKKEEVLVIPVIVDNVTKKYRQKMLRGKPLHLIQRLRDEAHRFSRTYHHKLVKRKLINSAKLK